MLTWKNSLELSEINGRHVKLGSKWNLDASGAGADRGLASIRGKALDATS